MPHADLNHSFVKGAACPNGKRKIEYIDRAVEGFFVEVLSSGVKTFYQRYVDQRRRQRQVRIGRADIVPLAEARKRALRIKADVALGKDPKQSAEQLRDIPLLKDFIHARYLPFVRSAKRSWKTDEAVLRRHVVPALGHLYLDEIKPHHIQKTVIDMRSAGFAPGTCNRPVIFLRYMLNLAADWGIPKLERNPAKKVALFEEVKRERYLSAAEMRALMGALQEDENQLAAMAIELLLLTGGRRNEITHARWEYVSLDQKTLLVPLSKSGKPRLISLNQAAIELIERLPSKGRSDWLFPSPRTGQPSPALYYPWRRVCDRAGLKNVRLHDLRHSFASNLVNGGVSLYVVQQLLGHCSPATTQRYAHLQQETLGKASEVAAEALKRAVGRR